MARDFASSKDWENAGSQTSTPRKTGAHAGVSAPPRRGLHQGEGGQWGASLRLASLSANAITDVQTARSTAPSGKTYPTGWRPQRLEDLSTTFEVRRPFSSPLSTTCPQKRPEGARLERRHSSSGHSSASGPNRGTPSFLVARLTACPPTSIVHWSRSSRRTRPIPLL